MTEPVVSKTSNSRGVCGSDSVVSSNPYTSSLEKGHICIDLTSPAPPASTTPYLFAGYDPGTTNKGLAWYDPKRCKMLFEIRDIHIWGGYRHTLRAPYDYNQRMIDIAKDPAVRELFMMTSHFGMERQDHPERNLSVVFAACIFEQTIRCLYPHMNICLVRPQAVRRYFNTSGSDYGERKNNSTQTDLLSPYDQERYNMTFYKKKLQVDAIEAGLIAMYVSHHVKECMVKPLHQRVKPATDGVIRMTAIVDARPRPEPISKPKKKRRKTDPATPTKRAKKGAARKKTPVKRKKQAKKRL
jgi:hypothetical protein